MVFSSLQQIEKLVRSPPSHDLRLNWVVVLSKVLVQTLFTAVTFESVGLAIDEFILIPYAKLSEKTFTDLFMTKFYFRGKGNNLFFAFVRLLKFSWHDTYLINEEVKKNAKKITILNDGVPSREKFPRTYTNTFQWFLRTSYVLVNFPHYEKYSK